MKILPFLFLCTLVLPAAAQEYDPHLSYINRKTIAIGYTQLGIDAHELNEMLIQAGYHSLESSVGAVSLSVGTDFGPSWGAYYGADIGITTNDKNGGKYQRFQYYRFYTGAAFTILCRQGFELLGNLGLSYSDATLRLYDTVADTTSFTNYISGTADAKRFQIGRWGIDIGFHSRFRSIRNMDNIFIGLDAGYIIALGSNDWTHDAGHFEGTPHTALGSWYIGARLGGLFRRRITRIPAAEFELHDKPKPEP